MLEYNQIVARVLALDLERVNDSLTPSDVSDWDSLAQLSLVAELETHYRVLFETEEIFRMTSIGEIRQILSLKLNQREATHGKN